MFKLCVLLCACVPALSESLSTSGAASFFSSNANDPYKSSSSSDEALSVLASGGGDMDDGMFAMDDGMFACCQ